MMHQNVSILIFILGGLCLSVCAEESSSKGYMTKIVMNTLDALQYLKKSMCDKIIGRIIDLLIELIRVFLE
ncbi:unnamed protein product [Heterobilharzia americana]|nr:unnamed protein product [Heterobilharzia americana]